MAEHIQKTNAARLLEAAGVPFELIKYEVDESDLSAGQNAFFVDKPGKAHNFENWIVDLYNITSVFFRAP